MQKQKWFIMKFVGNSKDINIKTNKPEFLEWKWIEPNELPKVVVSFKTDVYRKLLEELKFLKI